jgi:allantoate deiminase
MPGVEHLSGTAPTDPAWSASGILEKLDRLATCTERDGEITRLFLTPEHARAIDMLRAWMQQAGLQTSLDPSGTLIGTLPGASPGAPRLLLGSHIDTVRNAGRYDGCLGVLTGIALGARFRHARLPYTLEIRAFGDEEGVRFPVTLTGAHATAGTFDPDWLAAQDSEGITFAEALETFGLDPKRLKAGGCKADCAFAYLEIHIEQGPVLEAANLPVGVVTAINGAARWELKITGKAGHAGTVPMAQRQDALAAAAAMILAAQRVARGRANVVATTGRIAVSPGATNVIPGECIFALDLRAPDDALRDAAEQEIFAAFRQTAAQTATTLTATRLHAAPATACDPRLQACLAAAITATGLPVLQLPSGAGHDAMAVASLCPVGMLFVRCAGGISHHPDESVSESDVAIALDVMAATLQHIDPADFIPPKTT